MDNATRNPLLDHCAKMHAKDAVEHGLFACEMAAKGNANAAAYFARIACREAKSLNLVLAVAAGN